MKKRSLPILLAVMMLPVMVLVFCHCAEAAPVNQVMIKSVPCHDCCPHHVSLSSSGCAVVPEVSQAVSAGPLKTSELLNPILGLSGDWIPSSPVPEEMLPGFFSPPGSAHSTPLFILHQVFRI